ncbi:MAG: TIGR04282 family arsenosugar biosynthesis glycosyltransferase [Proteobacteria bacterium]|nr:TIGR04282 family arsenosugar biosynthesis glycosyltransferase [Pseudomonadota bacterium]
MEASDALVMVFARLPEAGRVKTRLAASLGDRAAAGLYAAFAADLLARLSASGVPLAVGFDPPEAGEAVGRWLPGKNLFPQEGADLGERMKNAFARAFARGVERAVLVGSDLPDLPARAIREALEALETRDAVLGPTPDGGYYLIGFTRRGFAPGAFSGPAWGGPDVFACTLRLLDKAGASVQLLFSWNDVDTAPDLVLLAKKLATRPGDAPATAAFLAGLGRGPA